MRILSAIAGEAIVLLVLALVVGLSVNAVRGRDHINPWTDYRLKLPARANGAGPVGNGTPEPGQGTSPSAAAEPDGPTSDKPFREITIDQVIETFQDERTSYGAHVFVDARADGPYKAGHIPGALQCDYYRKDTDLPRTVEAISGADKIIVYCNGGQCEDSLHLCGELCLANIPWERIYVFKGGWEEWHASGMPVQTGRPEDQPEK